ncbi:MAG: hypothetical protein ACE5R4_00425 [Armatimonadota bacterium]
MQAAPLSVHVTTDRSVNCSSTESIVADVCRGLTTDQEKAIALFDFVRRLVFHYPNRVARRDVHDTLHILNTYGYCFCSQQALLTVDLWREAGIKGQVWTVTGHSTAQAEYDGRHHWFDPLIGAYVFRRDGKTIASLQDIAGDPTLLTRAVAEGRACPGMVPCRTVLKDDSAAFCKHDPNYIRDCAGHGDDVTFMANLAADAKPWRWGGPRPSKYSPGLTLRRGEEVVYLWESIPGQAYCNVLKPDEKPKAYWVTPDQLPPHHICGEQAEQRDSNRVFWEPYVRTVAGVRTGRYAANGRHTYWPDLASERAIGDFAANTFQRSTGDDREQQLRVPKAGRMAHLIVEMRTPHVYTGGELRAEFQRATAGDIGRIWLLKPTRDDSSGRKPEARVKLWDAAEAKARAGKLTAVVKLDGKVRGLRHLRLRIECRTSGNATQAGLDGLRIEAIFQHNMFARPYLVSGSNEVSVKATGGSLEEETLTVTYAWAERGVLRTHTEAMTTFPQTYGINVAGEDLPRMVSLRMALER